MAVHVRLARHGSKKAPFYRIVVADQRCKRDGRFIEKLGTYDPRVAQGGLKVDRARLEYWRKNGALTTPTVERVLRQGDSSSADSVASPA
jgi:small subunit ribosomal protein S16